MRAVATCLWIALSAAAGEEPAPSDLKTLYDAHQWLELRQALEKVQGPALYRGAVASAFNDTRRAENLLRSVIKSAPSSGQAYDAYEWLEHLYLRTGQYRRLISTMEQRSAAFPNKNELAAERQELGAFRGLPDQEPGKPRSFKLHHEGNIFLPISINGRPARYFFDTGAMVSCMSESEARRIGLTIHETAGTLGTATGARTGFRTAVAAELTVGGMHVKNVTFAVFPDDQQPWSDLKQGQRGILGRPLLMTFHNLRWAKDGTVEIRSRAGRKHPQPSNLYFDEDNLVLLAGFERQKIPLTLDTGAETTDLYSAFANQFSKLLSESGKKDSTEVQGVGHTENFDSITVPQLTFQIGGLDTVLHPAHVLLKQIGPKWCLGNLGLDLLEQGRAFKMDFDSMTVELEPNP